MKRINIIGSSGSGKSTFAKALAQKLNFPHIQIDELFWEPNWTEPSDEKFFPKLENALIGDAWVLDGNYSRTRAIKWKDVDTVIWLDYSKLRTTYQVALRCLKRIWRNEELWPGTGNKESISRMFSRDSIVLYSYRNYDKVRASYLKIMSDPANTYIRFIHLKNPKSAQSFLGRIGLKDATI